MALRLQDFIDIEQFQILQDRLNEIYSFPSAIIDNDGTILTATAWQDVCTQFHRRNSECERECIKSDQYIASHLHEANPAVSYRCPHGLIDNATPIIIEGVHYGNFFTGQFFLEPPDLDFFRAQAKRYGFDEAAYIEAVRKVPVWNQQQLDSYLFFIKGLIEVIAGIGLKSIKELETRKRMQESEELSAKLLATLPDMMVRTDLNGQILFVNDFGLRMSGYERAEIIGQNMLSFIAPEDRERAALNAMQTFAGRLGPQEYHLLQKDGRRLLFEVNGDLLRNEDGSPYGMVQICRDITRRKQAEEEKRRSREIAERLAEEMAIIAEIGRIVGSTLNIDEVYEKLAAEVRKLIPFDRIHVNLNSPDGEYFTIAYASGLDVTERRPGNRVPLAGSISEVVTRTRAGLYFYAPTEEEIAGRFPGASAVTTFRIGMHSIMAVPLIYRDKAIGVLHFRSRTPHAYTEQDLRVAERIGAQIAGAIANAQLFKDLINTEKSLRESEGRYRALIEQAAVGVAEIEMETGRFLTVNRRLCELVGMTEGEMLATTFPAITHPEDLHLHEGKTAMLLAGEIGHYSLEKRYLRKDGAVIWVNITVSPLWKPGEKPGRNMIVVEDITERKRADEERRRNQEIAERLAREMAIIAEIGRVVGSTLDINQVFERVDAEVRNLIPYDRLLVNLRKNDEEFIVVYSSGVYNPGRRLSDSYSINGTTTGIVMATRSGILIQPADAEEIRDQYPNLYATFKTGLRSTMSVPLISVDRVIGSLTFRSKIPEAYTEQDLRLAERIGMQVAGAIANAQLFKDLINTEKSLRESEEHLQRAEKMEALGQLAGGVAHDLNNVLGIMSGYSELLLEEIPEGHRSRRRVEKILQSTEKGAAIIEDLLTLARRGVAASEVINLNSVVSDFLKAPVFEKTRDRHPRVTFRTERDNNLLDIKGSPVHLEKTLMNLVSNAAESITGKGEVTIRTESRYLDKPVIGYDAVKEGDYAVLTVSDTGMGIPAENREKIFEPFYTKKTMGRSGTGLGLAIVWGTVRDHNGYIDVQTEVGKGSTFTLYFPVTREEPTSPGSRRRR